MPKAEKKTVAGRPRAVARTIAGSGEPLYRQVVQSLRNDIVRGVYPVGAPMPSEEELTARFAVSRHTVREALRHLRTDGLVSSSRGSRTTVMPPPPATPFNVHRVASIDELIAYAAESRYAIETTAFVTSEQVAADEPFLPAGQRWLQLRGLRLASDPASPPVCWTEVFVSAEFAGVERLLPRQQGPIWRLIEDLYGVRLTEVEQTLRVRSAPPAIGEALHVAAEATVVEVCRTYRNTSGQVAEVSVNLYPADKFRFSMKLSRA